MVRKDRVYDLLGFGWFGLLFFGGAGLVVGYAEGVIDPAGFPGGVVGLAGGFAVVGLSTGLLLGNLQERSWKKAGRTAGLEPEAPGVLGAVDPRANRPDMTGEVRGRPVRVHTYTQTVGSGNNRRSATTYTVVSAALDRPVEDGVHLAPEREEPDGIQVEFMPGSAEAMAEDRGFTVTGDRADAFEAAIRSGPAETALSDLTYFGGMSVGDSNDAVLDGVGGALVEAVGDVVDADVAGQVRDSDGSASEVSHRTKGVILDGDEMARQVEAVVAVAEAVEGVEAGGQRA